MTSAAGAAGGGAAGIVLFDGVCAFCDAAVAWLVRYAAAKPTVRGLEKNRQGEFVIDGNIYGDMLTHIYMVEKA